MSTMLLTRPRDFRLVDVNCRCEDGSCRSWTSGGAAGLGRIP